MKDTSTSEAAVFPTRFDDLGGLGALPWFERYDDRVVLSDRSLPPIIDVHTHVALAYLRPMQVDLYRDTEHTEYYLPSCCSIDLEPYVNRNIPADAMAEMKRDLSFRSATGNGMRRTHTAANLLREMGELGVERSVLLPIDFPFFSENASYSIQVGKHTDGIVPFGSVHPYSPNLAAKVDLQMAAGVRGFKMHPAVQLVRPDDARAMQLYRLAGERNLPILWHCGPVGIEMAWPRHLSQVKYYEKPLAENPKTRFVLGHAGALQFDEALELVKKYPNAYLETSSQGLHGLRRILDGAPEDRILFGSDWPFYHQAVPLAKVLILTHDRPALRRKILHDNAVRLLGLPD